MDKTNYLLDKVSQIESELQLQAQINQDTQEKIDTSNNKIDSLNDETKDLTSQLKKDISSISTNTTELQEDLLTLSTSLENVLSDMQELKNKFTTTDSNVNSLLTSFENIVDDFSTQITNEASARQNDISILQTKISTEEATRCSTDSALQEKITTTTSLISNLTQSWINKIQVLTTATGTTVSIDLKDYLPDVLSNYQYEVLLGCDFKNSSTSYSSQSQANIYSDIIGNNSNLLPILGASSQATRTAYYSRGNITIPVKRYLYFESQAVDEITLKIYGYRRIN